MKEPSHIANQGFLSQYRQVCTMIGHVITVARAGGLSEKKAESIYKQILDAYSTLNGDAFWLFKDEIIRLLVTPDSQFDAGEGIQGTPLSRN